MTHDDDRGDVAGSSDEEVLDPAPRSRRTWPRAADTDDTGDTDGAADAPDGTARATRPLPFWQELIVLLTIALLLAVGIKALFVQAFYIPSGSMKNTLVLQDRILVEKVSYWGSASPQRGDIVVFSDPGGWLDEEESPQPSNVVAKALELVGLFPTGGHLVKRVIGVGGDRVMCCDKQGHVRVDGTPLQERAYLKPGERPSTISFDVKVPQGYLWVMGDNRSASADSRLHLGDPGGGFVPVEDVVGKVFAVVWPLSHLTLVHRPATFARVGSS